MKYCRNCSTASDDAVLVCPTCGSRDFYKPEGAPLSADNQQGAQAGQYGYTRQNGQAGQYGYAQQSGQAGQYGYAPQNGQAGQYGYAPQNGQTGQYGYAPQNGYAQPVNGQQKKKRSHTGLIIGIVVGFLVLIIGGSVLATFLIGRFVREQGMSDIESWLDDADVYDFLSPDDGEDDADEGEDVPQVEPPVPGVLENDVYVSEWANLRFAMPDNWAEASQEAYDSYAGETSRCDLYAVSENRELLAIVFADLSAAWDAKLYSETRFLNEVLDGMVKSYPEGSVEVTEHSTALIGGEQYEKASVIGNMNGVDLCITEHVRRIGDYYVIIAVTGASEEGNEAIAAMLEAAH